MTADTMAYPRAQNCRFRFQCGTGNYPIDLPGFNWNTRLAPITAENMMRSGEDTLWFNPIWCVLVQPFAYKKLCGKMFRRSASVWGTSQMSTMHSLKRRSRGQPIPIEIEEMSWTPDLGPLAKV